VSPTDTQLAGIEAARVNRWLADHVDRLAGPLQFTLIAGGRSNLTYRVTDAAGRVLVLRRPPTGGVLSSAHDVNREWRFITALTDTAVPVPTPVAFCADPAVTGAPFYLTGFVDGGVLADVDDGLAMAPQARARAAGAFIDTLACLHAIDPVAVGLGDMVRSTGYAERQLRRWHAQIRSSGARNLALLDEIHDLLAGNIPAQKNVIVHGDYRPGNVSFAADGAVRAVFDWELATTGDPLADLGWLASMWQDPGEDMEPTSDGPSTVTGFPSRDQILTRYACQSGRDVSDLPYWVAFAFWRSACIATGVRSRYQAGHMADDGFAAQLARADQRSEAIAHAAREALRALKI
jgi:aminoglycoside phosphotransferase (APT) family kinase protein